MGLLDQILGGLGGMSGRGAPTGRMGGGGTSRIVMSLLPIVLSMLANRQRGGMGSRGGLGGLGGLAGAGGLGALIAQMTQRGYGRQAQSWVSTGPNEPLPPQAVSEVFGQDELADIAAQAGLSEDETREGLSELLPEVVDRVTPEGRLPEQDQLLASIDDFERRLTG
jgi:uncharacterized protein YidB (DUF937 family)